jgi:hypothetical protein
LVIHRARIKLLLLGMHGTFLQKVILTMVAALFFSGLIEAWKFTLKANDEINAPTNWQHTNSKP